MLAIHTELCQKAACGGRQNIGLIPSARIPLPNNGPVCVTCVLRARKRVLEMIPCRNSSGTVAEVAIVLWVKCLATMSPHRIHSEALPRR
eukprot:5794343-Amphidinium_carterae.1